MALWMWRLPLCLAALNLSGVTSVYDRRSLRPCLYFP